jgi:predicted Zn-dependent peptidase
MDGLATSAVDAAHLLADLAIAPTLDEARIEARRDEYADEIDVNAAQPSFHRQRLMRRVVFGDHVYGQTAEADDVRTIEAETIRAHHAAAWGPNRARLYVVGAVDTETLDAITAAFAHWDVNTEPWVAPDVPVVTTCNEAHVVVRPDSAQTSVSWVGPGIARDDDGWFDALVANQVVGGGPSARLFMHLREEKSYTYGAYSRPMHYPGFSLITASSDVRGDVTTEALDAFVIEWNRAADEVIPDDQLTDARDYLSGILPIDLERNGPLAGYVSDLIDSNLGIAYLDGYRDAVTAVTAADASAAASDLFGRDDLTLIMVGEREIAVPAARAHASAVHVYDLDGALVETLDGDLDSTCPTPFVR